MEMISEQFLKQTLYRFYAAFLLYPEPQRSFNLKIGASWLKRQLEHSPLLGQEEGDGTLSRLISWIEEMPAELAPLQGEWMRLFGVSRHGYCYPFEGAQWPSEATGMLMASLQQQYARAGLFVAVDDLPDSVSVELEFLSHLCRLEWEAEESGDRPRLERARSIRLDFLKRHVSRWLPGLAKRVEQSNGGIYADACRAAVSFAEEDMAHLATIREEETRCSA